MYQEARALEIRSLTDIPLSEVDLVLLDLDNTLYEYKKCHQKALDTIIHIGSQRLGINEEEVHSLYLESRKKVNARHRGTAASHSRLFYIQAMVECVFKRTDTELTTFLYQLYWDTFINEMTLFSDAQIFLDSCSTTNIPIVLVTDMTTEIQFLKIKKLNIGKYFQFIVTSEEVGVEKPDPHIFEYAIKKINRVHEIANIVVIGDDHKKDFFEDPSYCIRVYHLNKQ